MANRHPSTEYTVGHTRSKDLNMKESLNWRTKEQYLSDYCFMTAVNLVIPNEMKTLIEASLDFI